MMERLGLHTGPVVAGNVGSKDRFNYTRRRGTPSIWPPSWRK